MTQKHIAEAETYSADYTTIYYWAQRADGVWFRRYRHKTPWGYRTTSWVQCNNPPERVSAPVHSYRLPAELANRNS